MSIDNITVATRMIPGRLTLLASATGDLSGYDFRSVTAHITPHAVDLLLTALSGQDERSSQVPVQGVLHTDSGLDYLTGALAVANGRVIADVYELWCSVVDHQDCGHGHLHEQEADLGPVDAWRSVVLPLTLALGAPTHRTTAAAAA